MNKLLLIAIIIGLFTGGAVTLDLYRSNTRPMQQHPMTFKYGLQPAVDPVITHNPQAEQNIDWGEQIQPSDVNIQGR